MTASADDEEVERDLDQAAEPGFALAKELVGPLALGHVADRANRTGLSPR